MRAFKNFLNRIKKPHGLVYALFCLVTSVFIVCSILCLVYEVYTPFACVCFVFTALFIIYIIYSIIYFVPIIKRKGKKLASKTVFTKNFVENYGFRSFFFLGCSLSINIAYVIFHGVVGFLTLSVWSATLCLYFLILTLLRTFVFLGHFLRRNSPLEERRTLDAQNFRQYGTFILLISIAMAGAVIRMIYYGDVFEYPGITIYVCSAYAVYRIFLAIYNIFKSSRQKYLTVRAIKYISFADALVSVLALQTAILSVFDAGNSHRIENAITGTIVCFTIFILGVSMMIIGDVQTKKLEKERKENQKTAEQIEKISN